MVLLKFRKQLSKNRREKSRARRLRMENLEDRRLLATFGTPWPNARELAVSFPTDQAAIGAYSNSIRGVFDQVADRREWQEEALRAFQTWSYHADINVGLVPDHGDDFGALGLSANDPRFGEFRIGAFPQPEVLANALPYQQVAGTWSGDVLLDTQTNYFLGDWEDSDPIEIPEPTEKGPAVELFSVLLHEAGNALGLEDISNPNAVMHHAYMGPKGALTQADIDEIRGLYGARTDPFEFANNNQMHHATKLHNPVGFTGAEPLTTMGSLQSSSDVDYFEIIPLAGKEKLTVRLQVAGISLLKAQLEVVDDEGEKISDVNADSVFENNLALEIGSLEDHERLFIRIAGNTQDVFSVGDYRLEIDYRPPELQPSIVPPSHDADAHDDVDDDDFVSVDALFAQVGLLDTEIGQNDTLATATRLDTTIGFLANTRYELQASISSLADRDLWIFQAPTQTSPTMRINVDPAGLETPALEAFVLTETGDRVASETTRKADGGLSITVRDPLPGQDYVLFIRDDVSSQVASGNYVATVDFATNTADNIRSVFSGQTVSSSQPEFSRLNVPKTQLFRFDLLAQSAIADHGGQLSIFDAKTGGLVASFASSSGVARTEYVWLSAGSYYLRADARARQGVASGPVQLSLHADVISDDQGPNLIDPTIPPYHPETPDWEWNELPPMYTPQIIEYVEPPIDDPWESDFYFEYEVEFYQSYLA